MVSWFARTVSALAYVMLIYSTSRMRSGASATQETATTCRERCGGQGYLSCNRFGAILGFSHAGMTAEGDNR